MEQAGYLHPNWSSPNLGEQSLPEFSFFYLSFFNCAKSRLLSVAEIELKWGVI